MSSFSCVACSSSTPAAADPRLPLLRITLCGRCRDRIAYAVGWTRLQRRGQRVWWQRAGEIVQVPA